MLIQTLVDNWYWLLVVLPLVVLIVRLVWAKVKDEGMQRDFLEFQADNERRRKQIEAEKAVADFEETLKSAIPETIEVYAIPSFCSSTVSYGPILNPLWQPPWLSSTNLLETAGRDPIVFYCNYCGVKTDKSTGTCAHCGAPL